MALGISAALFAIFSINVVMGALSGNPFLDDIGEMLLLFASSLAFVAAILKREAAAKKEAKD